MAIFDDLKLEWDGNEYTIPSNRVMMAIASIEEIITLSELGVAMQKGTAPLAKIAMAYGSVLRFAGCTIEDDAVYAGMFSGDASAKQATIQASIAGLLQMMVPKGAFQIDDKGRGKPRVKPQADVISS